MDQKKYIGMDVHQASISVAVRDAAGKLVSESIIETKATTILEFIRGIRGSLAPDRSSPRMGNLLFLELNISPASLAAF